jgi:hypothetical protein
MGPATGITGQLRTFSTDKNGDLRGFCHNQLCVCISTYLLAFGDDAYVRDNLNVEPLK